MGPYGWRLGDRGTPITGVAQLLFLVTQSPTILRFCRKIAPLTPFLAILPSTLVVLETRPIYLFKDDDWLLTSLRWLELGSMQRLKRWRMDSRVKFDASDGAAWLAKCEGRGIEVRDQRQFFTGERILERLFLSRVLTILCIFFIHRLGRSDGSDGLPADQRCDAHLSAWSACCKFCAFVNGAGAVSVDARELQCRLECCRTRSVSRC